MADQGNIADKVKQAVQPGDAKSTAQKLKDTVGSGTDKGKEGGQGAAQTAKETVSKASESASQMFGGGGGGGK